MDKPGPTQTEETRRYYMLLAERNLDRIRRETGRSWRSDPLGACRHLGRWRPDLSRNTWRLYKASMIAFMRERGPKEAIEYLDGLSEAPCIRRSGNTSAQRKRSFPDRDKARLLSYLRLDRGEDGVDGLLAMWLISSEATGLRPCEWEFAHLDGDALLIRNAKATNGRGNGENRTQKFIPVNDQPQEVVEIIAGFLDALHERMGTTDFQSIYRKCRYRLYRVNKALWPRRKKKIHLYSPRHQFCANAKNDGMTLAEVAALMGHSSDRTATRHYAHRKVGNDKLAVRPEKSEIDRVRRVFNAFPDPDFRRTPEKAPETE